jgi:hypothetical protein
MSRRLAKPLVPLLVAVVAVLLGLFAMSSSYAGQTPGRVPVDAPVTIPPVHEPSPVPAGGGTPATPTTYDPGACSSCLGDGED